VIDERWSLPTLAVITATVPALRIRILQRQNWHSLSHLSFASQENNPSLHILTNHVRITTVEPNAFANIVMEAQLEQRLIHLILCASLPNTTDQQQPPANKDDADSLKNQQLWATLATPPTPPMPPTQEEKDPELPSGLLESVRCFINAPSHLYPHDVIFHLRCKRSGEWNGDINETCPYTLRKRFTVNFASIFIPWTERLSITVGSAGTSHGIYTFETSGPLVSIWTKAFVSQRHRPFWRPRVSRKRVRLAELDPGAICIALCLVHDQEDLLPRSVNLRTLAHLANLSAQYDVNKLLRAYLDDWLAPHHLRISEPGYEAYLNVAWQFGIEEDYLGLANHLVMNCTIDDAGQLLAPGTRDRIQLGAIYADHEHGKSPTSIILSHSLIPIAIQSLPAPVWNSSANYERKSLISRKNILHTSAYLAKCHSALIGRKAIA
jgi:hypothetical protein